MIDQIRIANDLLTVAMFFFVAGFCWTAGAATAGFLYGKFGVKKE